MGRRSLWVASVVCACIVSLAPPVAAAAFAAPGVALVLTGDAELAAAILRDGSAPGPLPIAALGLAVAAGCVVWCRVYAVALWASDAAPEEQFPAAWDATTKTWPRLLVLYGQVYGSLAAGAVALLVLSALAGRGVGTMLLGAVLLLLVARTIARVYLAHAARAVILDGAAIRESWARSKTIVRDRRHQQIMAWMTLMAAGVTVWIGGRLISPVIQETALEYPAGSAFALVRELGQFTLAVPLEAALIGLATVLWTAVYRDRVEIVPPAPRARRDGWAARALATILVLTLIANGAATAVESVWAERQARAEERVGATQIEPRDAAGAAVAPRPSPSRTQYFVTADLDGARLEWRTKIDYLNDSGEWLADIGLHLYPAAYSNELEDIPLARELLAVDVGGMLGASARPGTFSIETIEHADGKAGFAVDGTGVVVDLPDRLAPGERTTLQVELGARLPRWPDRYGVWRDLVLLGNWIPAVAKRAEGAWRLDPYGSIGDPFYADAADYHVTIETDESIGVVGTGALTQLLPWGPGRARWHFEAPGVRDAAFAASPSLRGVEGSAGEVTVRSWYPAAEPLRGEANLRAATDALAFYRSKFGPLPYEEIEVVETYGYLGGMEYPGIVFVSGNSSYFAGIPLLEDLVSYAGFEAALSRYTVGHEIAHQWWYATVGNDQINEPWLDEALAETSARLWLDATGEGERTWRMASLSTEAGARAGAIDAGVDDFSNNGTYTEVVYDAGGAILLELARRVGKPVFFRVLRAWHARNVLGVGTIDRFIATFGDVAGRKAADFLESFRGPGSG